MSEWKTIDSAPRDGTKFIVYTDRLGVAVVYHNVDDPMPLHIEPSGLHLMIDDGKFEHPIRGDYPLYWMPLPEPPK